MSPSSYLTALGFGFQGWEWLIILIVALLLFGRRLPEIMRGLGSSVREFKKGMEEPPAPPTPPPAVPDAVSRPALTSAAPQPPPVPPAAPTTPAPPAPPASRTS
ncbi:MAG: twin-arginine translocase TatA/TatE family subunit [Planctomycetota bacterium]|nr:twin-arginine translocase TatA/TatE family subunit [Planctomycetota bacterium]